MGTQNEIFPQIYASGSKKNLKFEHVWVSFPGKAVKCSTIIEAVDLCFKSFYIFNCDFPTKCHGAWQFLEFCVYNMKTFSIILSSVKELAAFVCSNED